MVTMLLQFLLYQPGVTDSALKDLLTNLVIEVFSYVAESEREKIRERQQQGIRGTGRISTNLYDKQIL